MTLPRFNMQRRALFLRQLERLVRLRVDFTDDLNWIGARLLDRAIAERHQDCIDEGAAGEAVRIMRRLGVK